MIECRTVIYAACDVVIILLLSRPVRLRDYRLTSRGKLNAVKICICLHLAPVRIEVHDDLDLVMTTLPSAIGLK